MLRHQRALLFWNIVTMRTLFAIFRADEVGSTMSAEMALVTSVTVGALFMGMGEFSRTVNNEFQNSARIAGLMDTEEVVDEEDASESEKKHLEEKSEQESVGWRFRRAEDQQTTDGADSDQ